ncbi:MAG TPA: hypothetical protein VGN26_10435 [Armatimonadota bacterium]|jgi:hypothetical protein
MTQERPILHASLSLAAGLALTWAIVGGVYWRLSTFGPGMPKPNLALWDGALALCGALFGLTLAWGTHGIRRYVPDYLRSAVLIALVYLMAYGLSEALFHGFFRA